MSEGMEASFCSCDFEIYEWFKSDEVVARKQHRCCECNELIKQGEPYERSMGKMDGAFWHHKTCLPCTRIRADYCAPYGGLREHIWYGLEVDICGEWGEGEESDGE